MTAATTGTKIQLSGGNVVADSEQEQDGFKHQVAGPGTHTEGFPSLVSHSTVQFQYMITGATEFRLLGQVDNLPDPDIRRPCLIQASAMGEHVIRGSTMVQPLLFCILYATNCARVLYNCAWHTSGPF